MFRPGIDVLCLVMCVFVSDTRRRTPSSPVWNSLTSTSSTRWESEASDASNWYDLTFQEIRFICASLRVGGSFIWMCGCRLTVEGLPQQKDGFCDVTYTFVSAFSLEPSVSGREGGALSCQITLARVLWSSSYTASQWCPQNPELELRLQLVC